MTDWTPLIIAILAFCAMGGVAYVAGQHYLRATHLYRRLIPLLQGADGDSNSVDRGVGRLVARHFDEKRFGVDETLRGQLRLNLVRAGYFRRDAINFYVFWRLAVVALLPFLTYFVCLIAFPDARFITTLIAIVVAMGLGLIVPDAFISRRQRLLSRDYRNVFPEFLDLMVVCVDAGLSLEGALDRITTEMSKRNRYFGINLAVMGAEIRAGRTFMEALGTLADRLMILEARSLVAMLRQSSELGSDIAEGLRVFSAEMRVKRLLRAEEQANKLGVKMLAPLALFIFPVVLMIILLPLAIRIGSAFHSMGIGH
jgi:tight adherence protein C